MFKLYVFRREFLIETLEIHVFHFRLLINIIPSKFVCVILFGTLDVHSAAGANLPTFALKSTCYHLLTPLPSNFPLSGWRYE